MPIVDTYGTLEGFGDVAGSPAYWVNVSGLLSGEGSVGAIGPVVTFLLGGQAFGAGTIRDDLLVNLSAEVAGVGALTGELVVSSALTGAFSGSGDLRESAPLPLRGYGTLQAYLEVLTVPRPVCGPRTSVPTLGYMQTLGPGDLTLTIRDAQGNAFSPARVTYALYQVTSSGYRQLRGPTLRTPVMTFGGTYYATGLAGECGQPGNYVIVWTWQRAQGFPCESQSDPFIVQDAAMRAPCDPNRKRKYGWGC